MNNDLANYIVFMTKVGGGTENIFVKFDLTPYIHWEL